MHHNQINPYVNPNPTLRRSSPIPNPAPVKFKYSPFRVNVRLYRTLSSLLLSSFSFASLPASLLDLRFVRASSMAVEVYSCLHGERLEPRRAVLRVMISRILQPWLDPQSSMHGDVVYNGRFHFPSRKLCQPDEARVAVSAMLAAVGIPVPEEDLERIGHEIAFKAAMIAGEARLLGRGPSIVAHIRIYLPEPLWVFEPEDDSADIPASTPMPWQRFQAAAAAISIDGVLVLDEGDLGRGGRRRRRRRCFGGIPALSSAIKNLDRMSYDGECREQACVICTEDFEEQGARLCRMPCRHVFHEDCLVRWLEQSRVCPLCRFSLQ